MATFTMFSYEFKGIEKLAQGEANQTELRFDDVDVKKSIAHKQEIFQSFFTLERFPTHFTLGNRRYACQLQWSKQGIIVFKISNKHTLRQDKEFQTNILDTEPWTIVVIDNRKDRQLIAILKRPQAFRDNSAVAKLLQKNLTPFLHKQRLAIQIDAQYHAQDVWKLIDQYRPQGIQYIEFLLPFPNKPWITKTFREVMDVALTANGQASVKYKAAKGSRITFYKGEGKNAQWVEAASGAGADTVIKPAGCAAIHTKNVTTPVEKTENENFVEALDRDEIPQSVQQQIWTFCDTFQDYYD